MKWVIVVLCAVYALILLVFMTSIKVHITTLRKQFICMKVTWLGIKVYSAVFYIRLKHHVRPEIFRVKRYGFKKIYSFRFTKKREAKKKAVSLQKYLDILEIQIEQFNIFVGSENAFTTAMLCGVLRLVLDAMIKIFLGSEQARKLQVLPRFNQNVFLIEGNGIICSQVADIIRILLRKRR